MLCLIDELIITREALAICVKRKLNSLDVLETLADVMIRHGRPDYYPLGQWPGIHCQNPAQLDCQCNDQRGAGRQVWLL